MLASLEKKVISIIKSQKTGIFPLCLKGMLYICSQLYAIAITLRNKAFEKGLLKQYRISTPVISIGNIVVGGTGKTPLTLLLAEELSQYYSVGILSRGYRSKAEKGRHPLLTDATSTRADLFGDESLLLARRLPTLKIFAGKDRVQAAEMAIDRGCQVVILDDGMQHRRLARSFELVIMDAADPFGQSHLLPRGFLREPLSGLKRADLIVINHITTAFAFARLRQKIASYTSAPLIATQMRVKNIRRFPNDTVISCKDKRVALFCGLAEPNHFRKLVKQQGAILVAEQLVADHQLPTEEALTAFAEYSKKLGAEYLICTEKDRVKLTKETLLPIIWIEAELEIVAGQEQWKDFLNRLFNMLEIKKI